jgi:hypothetical protein
MEWFVRAVDGGEGCFERVHTAGDEDVVCAIIQYCEAAGQPVEDGEEFEVIAYEHVEVRRLEISAKKVKK